jgi:hypothetical protein
MVLLVMLLAAWHRKLLLPPPGLQSQQCALDRLAAAAVEVVQVQEAAH